MLPETPNARSQDLPAIIFPWGALFGCTNEVWSDTTAVANAVQAEVEVEGSASSFEALSAAASTAGSITGHAINQQAASVGLAIILARAADPDPAEKNVLKLCQDTIVV